MSTADEWIASSEAEAWDIQLAPYDCLATQAHVLMLARQGIMNTPDAVQALQALQEIEQLCADGQFRYEPGHGAQLTLEKMIVDRVGPQIGYQVHTGRSRNDQVMAAQRLCVRERLLELLLALGGFIEALLALAEAERDTVMPGYTHMQPARPTTVGQWAAAYAELLLRDAARLQDAYHRHDASPLGAAESHGTTWPLDRDYVRELLAFSRLEEIPLAAVSSRGESDADFLSGLAFVSLHLSKLAQDLLLYTSFEYGYVQLGGKQATRMGKLTGSSVMPQKRNPDVLELLRAQSSEIYAALFQALGVLRGLPSGYNRDSRETKGPILRSLAHLGESLRQAQATVEGLEFDRPRMQQAVLDNHSMATDLAEHLAQRHGIPYREMHGIVGRVVARAIDERRSIGDLRAEELRREAELAGYLCAVTEDELDEACDPQAALGRRRNLGGAAGDVMQAWIEARGAELAELGAWTEAQQHIWAEARARLRDLAGQI